MEEDAVVLDPVGRGAGWPHSDVTVLVTWDEVADELERATALFPVLDGHTGGRDLPPVACRRLVVPWLDEVLAPPADDLDGPHRDRARTLLVALLQDGQRLGVTVTTATADAQAA